MEQLIDAIEKRWSPRAFDSKEVEIGKLETIFEAARRSPSSNNEQPWRFIIGIKSNNTAYAKLFEALNEFNQKWAEHAPVVGVVIGQENFTKNGNSNPHHAYDVGQAMAYLTLQATAEGLFVHQMAGFFPEKIQESFNIPVGYKVITMFVLGYLGSPEILSEDYKKNEYKKVIRKNLNEIILESWDKPFSFKN